MFDKIYILNAKLNGVKNIDKSIELAFYKQTVDKSFDITNYRVKAVFGENGCGKTALISAFSIVRDIVLDARYLSDSNKQSLLEELINKKEKKFKFSCDYIVCEKDDNHVYRYSIEVNHDDSGFYIENEQLSRKNGNYSNNSFKEVFNVNNGELEYLDVDNNSGVLDYYQKKSINLLKYHSFVSIFLADLSDEKQIKGYAYDLFGLLLFFISINVYIGESDKHDIYMLYNELNNKVHVNDKNVSLYISDMLNRITSTGDDKVKSELFEKYKKKIERLSRFIRLFKSDLQNIDIKVEEDADYYKCRLKFNYGKYVVDREFESTGIKKLISIFDAIDSACHGGIVFIDELDANINAIYLEKIIEYIIIYGDGQLCFSTHGLEIMDLLKTEKLAIDFLTNDKEVVHWVAKGNNSPINYYKKGFVKGIPYNIDSVDLLDIFMEKK